MCKIDSAVRRTTERFVGLQAWLLTAIGAASPAAVLAQAHDTGVRPAATDGGAPVALAGLSSNEMPYFEDGARRFQIEEVVSGATSTQGNGLGPRFNSNSCSSCHAQPYVGGSSPRVNPLFSIATAAGAVNHMPWFEAQNGPIREARFVQSNGVADGGVHNLFVVTGRSDAGSCNIAQPSFLPAGDPVSGQGGNRNIVFRIPTPTLGAGLIEAIPDSVILANQRANSALKQQAGVSGHPNSIQGGNVNRSANDGTITRFGWKAQNKSLLMFAGEAYNVEMGISNQLFPQERDEAQACQATNATPNDTDNFPPPGAPVVTTAVLSDVEAFANFTRMLAPPHLRPPPRRPSTAGQFLPQSVARSVTPRRSRLLLPSRAAPTSPRAPPCRTSKCIFSRTCWCTTWGCAWLTASLRGPPGRTSSALRRSGAWGSACTFCMTAVPAT